jgi:uncharacterized membrane protein
MINEKTINKNLLLTKKTILLIPVIIFSTFLITLSAKLKVPFYPVPMTMQPFVIVLLGAMLGWRLGATIILTYLRSQLYECIDLMSGTLFAFIEIDSHESYMRGLLSLRFLCFEGRQIDRNY